mmetsp:Transcript_40629/g.129585  ORF Transcript_40629/g.129585 Transcript_40629/m.129585 type:complete len:1207 (-) Transcript_40629:1-3621(-)
MGTRRCAAAEGWGLGTVLAALVLLGSGALVAAQENCTTCLAQCAAEMPDDSYECPERLEKKGIRGKYAGQVANYLSYETQVSSPNMAIRAQEFERCTGARIVFHDAENAFTNPQEDVGTKAGEGSALYDAYLMSYSHYPELSALGLLEVLTERVEQDLEDLDWFDTFPAVRRLATYRRNGRNDIDFLPYDGDYLLPIVRADLLEAHNLTQPATWEEARDFAAFFHGKDLNGDGEPDFGLCQFPKSGEPRWEWWFPEIVFSTWATMAQTQGSDTGFFFDPETFEPQLDSVAFTETLEIWKGLWNTGTSDCGALYSEGRCALGYGPPGCWKGVFLNGISRKDPETGEVVWRPTFESGVYADPIRQKPFGSLRVLNKESNALEDCNLETNCPFAEVVEEGPYTGRMVNRAPYFWSGGLGTVIRKSADPVAKDIMWDYFVYTNAPESSAYDVASYASWLDAWRDSQLRDPKYYLAAGWSQSAFNQHQQQMTWALRDFKNGALNIRIPGMKEYIYDVLFTDMRSFFEEDSMTAAEVIQRATTGWKEITSARGLLDQLQVYRSSLGMDALPEFKQCEIHRPLVDQIDVEICKKFDSGGGGSAALEDVLTISALAIACLLIASLFWLYQSTLSKYRAGLLESDREPDFNPWALTFHSRDLHIVHRSLVSGRASFTAATAMIPLTLLAIAAVMRHDGTLFFEPIEWFSILGLVIVGAGGVLGGMLMLSTKILVFKYHLERMVDVYTPPIFLYAASQVFAVLMLWGHLHYMHKEPPLFLATEIALIVIMPPFVCGVISLPWIWVGCIHVAASLAFVVVAVTEGDIGALELVTAVMCFVASLAVAHYLYLRHLVLFAPNAEMSRLQMLLKENKLRSEYIASTAHDLRTPIQAFRGVIDILRLSAGPEQYDLLGLADAAIDMMRLTVENVLDFATMDAGSALQPQRAAFSLRTMVGSCVTIARAYGGASAGVAITHIVDDDLAAQVHSDFGWIQRMTMNLITNAQKFTKAGSITVQVSLVKGRQPRRSSEGNMSVVDAISMDMSFMGMDDGAQGKKMAPRASVQREIGPASHEPKAVLVEVIDTGAGLTRESIRKLFKPFSQLQDDKGGTGLGLYSVLEKAKILGGSAGVSSDGLGHGSTFWFSFKYTPVDGIDPSRKPQLSSKGSPTQSIASRTCSAGSISDLAEIGSSLVDRPNVAGSFTSLEGRARTLTLNPKP